MHWTGPVQAGMTRNALDRVDTEYIPEGLYFFDNMVYGSAAENKSF